MSFRTPLQRSGIDWKVTSQEQLPMTPASSPGAPTASLWRPKNWKPPADSEWHASGCKTAPPDTPNNCALHDANLGHVDHATAWSASSTVEL